MHLFYRDRYARIIQKLGFDAKFSEFKIQNIVGSTDVKFPIRLEGLAYAHGAFSSYEPEVRRRILSVLGSSSEEILVVRADPRPRVFVFFRGCSCSPV